MGTTVQAAPDKARIEQATDDALQRIRAALQGLRYGAVTALVQDGVVVLVERTEKVRLSHRERSS
ncbi:MAG TPA: YezD family protein [Candidatus Binatia bacterium]